jgi:hypothetical protein
MREVRASTAVADPTAFETHCVIGRKVSFAVSYWQLSNQMSADSLRREVSSCNKPHHWPEAAGGS